MDESKACASAAERSQSRFTQGKMCRLVGDQGGDRVGVGGGVGEGGGGADGEDILTKQTKSLPEMT